MKKEFLLPYIKVDFYWTVQLTSEILIYFKFRHNGAHYILFSNTFMRPKIEKNLTLYDLV